MPLDGIFARERPYPEADAYNYVGHVRIPTLMLNGKNDIVMPFELAVNPMFQNLGTSDKKILLYDSAHYVPQQELIKECLNWLDKYMGVVKR